MSILIDRNTPVIVQGITGKNGQFHTEQMLDYGTKVLSDDYLEIYVLHTEGGAITIDATSSHFGAFRLTGMES